MMMKFADLPLPAKKALLCNMVLELGHEDFDNSLYFDERREDVEDEWNALIREADKVWINETFDYLLVQTSELKAFVMNHSPDIAASHRDFNSYHEWYSQYDMPDHKDSIWPVFVDPECGEAFSDGWHRFHSYCKKGLEWIPVINFSHHKFETIS